MTNASKNNRHSNPMALLLLAGVLAVPTGAQIVSATDDGTVLKQIIIFARHGVRSSTVSPSDYAKLSPAPYPDFGVPPGYLTTHGWQAESLLGAYFRDYLLHERLLTGRVELDAPHAYFRANSIQRRMSPPPHSGRDCLRERWCRSILLHLANPTPYSIPSRPVW